MKAYNSPTDELHIKSNSGEELVKITPNETTIKNMDLSSLGVESTPEEIDATVQKVAENGTVNEDLFVVTFSSVNENFVCNVSAEDVIEAAKDNKKILCFFNDIVSREDIGLVRVYKNDVTGEINSVTFNRIMDEDIGTLNLTFVSISPPNSIFGISIIRCPQISFRRFATTLKNTM